MALVKVARCPSCKALQGDRHKVITPRPTDEMLRSWKSSGQAEATDGCACDPDGICEHGHYSWLIAVGWVERNPKARPKHLRNPIVKGRRSATKLVQTKGENEMPKAEKSEKVKVELVGGFRAPSTFGRLYRILSDGKAHTKGELTKALKDSDNPGSRIAKFRERGKVTGSYTLETLDDGRYLLKNHRNGKPAVKAKAAAKPAAKTAKKKVAPKAKPAEKETAVSVSDDVE